MMPSTHRRAVVTTLAAAAALVLVAATPAEALRLLTAPHDDDPTSALVGALGLAAWALALWLVLAAAVTALGHVPGRSGRVAAGAARRIAPGSVRRAIEVALGLAVSTAVLGAAPAAATTAPMPAEVGHSVGSLDWGSPVAVEPAPAASAAPAAPLEPLPVVVAPGDSLWALAERHLADRSAAAPSDAAVAVAWPSWWAANRDVIGPDPHLLRPGTSLVPPADPS